MAFQLFPHTFVYEYIYYTVLHWYVFGRTECVAWNISNKQKYKNVFRLVIYIGTQIFKLYVW